jgi:hypothetical protein
MLDGSIELGAIYSLSWRVLAIGKTGPGRVWRVASPSIGAMAPIDGMKKVNHRRILSHRFR